MSISFSRKMSLLKRGLSNYFLKRPFSISFEITRCCNARCKHCHLGGHVEEKRASPQRYGELCRELKPFIAQVSGGEPLLRRDLNQIIEALKIPNRAPYIIVTTNGVLLTKEKYFNLRQAGVDEFSLSFDFPDERHDDFRCVPGLFNKIENLMRELKTENDKSITLSCVIQRENFRELIRMAELAREWNVRINFSTYTWLRTKKKEYLIQENELSEFKDIIKQLLEFNKKYKMIYTSEYVFKKMIDFFEKESVPNCRAGEKFYIVNPDGSLSPCGLIIKNYNSRKEMKKDLTKNNKCHFCYTSIRANCEKPFKYLASDGLKSV